LNTNDEQQESSFLVPPQELNEDSILQIQQNGGSHIHLFYKVYRNGRYFFKKMLRPEYAAKASYREMLRKEYELGTLVDSEFIVHYYTLVDEPGECSVLTDYVNGRTLDVFLQEQPHYFSDATRLRRFIGQLCTALHSLHQHQALHLDLKPANVMLTMVNNDVRLIDLGCGYMDARPDTIGMTARYAAPEQLDGSYEVDARTDIYAIGKLLEWIDETNPLPSVYRQLAYHCLQERKEDRFLSVEELLQWLDKRNEQRNSKKKWLMGTAVLLIFLVGLSVWKCIRTSHPAIADGTVFMDDTTPDSLYFRILSVADHSVAVISPPENGNTYEGDIVMSDSIAFRGETFYIREIAEGAFRECSLLTNVHFPPTLLAIGKSAFRNCVRLNSLHLPFSLQHIEFEAFSSCSELDFVNWPASVKIVPRNCFVACDSLRSISLPEGVVSIGQDAFVSCVNLKNVELPTTLERIDRGAFFNCSSLEQITLPAHVRELGEYLFHKCSSLKEIQMLAPVPPAISIIVDKSFHGTVLVPAAALEAYQKAPGWKNLRLQTYTE